MAVAQIEQILLVKCYNTSYVVNFELFSFFFFLKHLNFLILVVQYLYTDKMHITRVEYTRIDIQRVTIVQYSYR